MNTESILKQFEIVKTSLQRAKLPFETGMMQKEVIEVTLYELIKSYHQIANLVREIAPERFGEQIIEKRVAHTPELSVDDLDLCPYCGSPDCTSDHK